MQLEINVRNEHALLGVRYLMCTSVTITQHVINLNLLNKMKTGTEVGWGGVATLPVVAFYLYCQYVENKLFTLILDECL